MSKSKQVAEAPTATVAAAAAATPSAVSGVQWKKDFGTVELSLNLFLATAFVFLSLIDYGLDGYILAQLSPHSCSGSNPLVQALTIYYQWKLGGSSLLKYWELFVLCVVPLGLIGLVSANLQTLRGVRAPLGRHVLDVENLLQMLTMIVLVATKAKPTTEAFIAASVSGRDSGAAKGDAALFGLITQMHNYHFLVFVINALQWFVPFLRVVFQKKQDAMRAREAAAALTAANKAAAAAAKAVAAATPTAIEMQKRMEEAEAQSTAAAAEKQQPESTLTKRK